MLLDQLMVEVSSEKRHHEPQHPPHNPDQDNRAAIVTMTLARSPSESERLLISLRALSRLKLPVYVGEGGSIRAFINQISRLPHVRVCYPPGSGRPTLVSQIQCAFSHAQRSNPEYIVYTEPDKTSFFRHGLPNLTRLGKKRFATDLGLVLAARDRSGFRSFPKGQQVAETLMNRLCGEALGQTGDYTYGPMLINNRLFPYTQVMPLNLGWGWRFFLIGVAHQLRLRVELHTVRNRCPRSQQDEDDERARDYRVRQLVENVTGLANGWTFLLHDSAAVPSAEMAAA